MYNTNTRRLIKLHLGQIKHKYFNKRRKRKRKIANYLREAEKDSTRHN